MVDVTGGGARVGVVQRLEVLTRALRAERALPAAERGTGADDGQLDAAVRGVSLAAQRAEEGNRPRSTALMAEVARSVSDSWAHTSPLAAEALACAQQPRRRVEAP